ncbi:hypothetical protein Pcinc_001465 [Petrolisthes cinctipes]|uniref:Peptidase A2 domain-containing protein n=1 Tax=Petrolisthes cinctipes TaxID=88211 RepID=A0AAE1L370_PETCI|nr:hypothetical protein Pcinc_001465 [Petrolisthes cinctipes]
MAEEFKLPTFNYNINAWFSHVDALWPNDYSDEKKYKSLLLALPTDAVCLLQALHTSYETAKASLLQVLGKPKQSYLSELNNVQALGRYPSLLLSHIRSLTIAAGTPCPDELLRHRVLQLMPPQLERRFPAHRPWLSGMRFLIDTGAALALVPAQGGHACTGHTSYDLVAANGTPITAYGIQSCHLALEPNHTFQWNFLVADVGQPFLGVDFLSSHNPLVDNKRR